jgi:hypothetical protein
MTLFAATRRQKNKGGRHFLVLCQFGGYRSSVPILKSRKLQEISHQSGIKRSIKPVSTQISLTKFVKIFKISYLCPEKAKSLSQHA